MQNDSLDNANLDPWSNMGNKAPSSGEVSPEGEAAAEEWENSMADAPEFADGNDKNDNEENLNAYDDTIANAGRLTRYGLVDAACRHSEDMEGFVRKIETFDAAGSTDPLHDFYDYIGINSAEEKKELGQEELSSNDSKSLYMDNNKIPVDEAKTIEGAIKAFADFKELIAEVEMDPRYEQLRNEAKRAQKGYFEYAVMQYGQKGLVELLNALAEEREKSDKQETEDESEDNNENSEQIEQLVA